MAKKDNRLRITLPERIRSKVEAGAERHEMSVTEYVTWLIDTDHDRTLAIPSIFNATQTGASPAKSHRELALETAEAIEKQLSNDDESQGDTDDSDSDDDEIEVNL